MRPTKRAKISHRSKTGLPPSSNSVLYAAASIPEPDAGKDPDSFKSVEQNEVKIRPTSNDTAHFFKLPRELRDEVYRHLLPNCLYGQDGSTDKDMLKCSNPVYLWEKGDLQVLRVNRQMNKEAEEIFWGTNTFQMILDSRSPRLIIFYAHPRVKVGVRSKGTKKIWSDRMEHKLRSMRSLVVIIPTHFTRYRCVYDSIPWYMVNLQDGMKRISRADAMAFFGSLGTAESASREKQYEMHRYAAVKQRGNRLRYKNDILYGFSRFVSLFHLLDDNSRFKYFELSFQSYLDWKGSLIGPSLGTKRSVEGKVPEHLMRKGNAINIRVVAPRQYD